MSDKRNNDSKSNYGSSGNDPSKSSENCASQKKEEFLNLSRGIGLLAFFSTVGGIIIVIYGLQEIILVFNDELHVQIRLDPIILKYKNSDFDGGLKNYLSIWCGAAVTGIVAGTIQIISSIWYIITAILTQEIEYKAKVWICGEAIVSLMLITIFGGIFIAGFEADDMIFSFGLDFILICFICLFSVLILRKEEKEEKGRKVMRARSFSGFSALLLI